MIIYMKGYRVSFPLPLIATPELVEFFSPVDELFFVVLRVGRADNLKCRLRPFFITNRSALQSVENLVRHEVIFVGLVSVLWAEFGSWVLNVNLREFFDGRAFRRPVDSIKRSHSRR